ncbi:hypothetical protein YQE_11606, partial [Dendroctonus ponderosae]
MGALLSTRQRNGVEEVDVVPNHAYKYPPRAGNLKWFQGNYFGSHFIMGGERFDTPQPESYLFGENTDLNFLGSRPTPFPYPPPQPNEPTKTLKCLVNIRKESLRFVRASSEFNKIPSDKSELSDLEIGTNSSFNIEFIFDCNVPCAITIHYLCNEEVNASGVTYVPRDPQLSSETFHYKKGANQQFCQPTHVFNPAKFSEDELQYDVDRELIPIAIHCVTEEGPEDMRQSHTTIGTVEKIADGIFLLKALKQKLWVDGLFYLLQEIYGIENKNNEKASSLAGGDEDTEDNGSECVICMCDVRDTLILPCRHLCLCNSCADSLRYQANNCPICRAPFRALLQIRALQKCSTPSLAPISQPDANCDNVPPGYEVVALIEALNGPCQPRQPPSAIPDLIESPDNESSAETVYVLNRQLQSAKSCSQPTTPEYVSKSAVTVMTNRSEDDSMKETQKCPLLRDEKELMIRCRRQRDSVKVVNEKEKEDIFDEDSEAEKLSPLLQRNKPNMTRSATLALHMDDVIDHIDQEDAMNNIDSTTGRKDKSAKYEKGEESDYYTPDEPSAPMSSAIYESQSSGNALSSLDSTPHKLPGTPISTASAKSSGDSFTSGESTKQLLTAGKVASDGDCSVHI